MKPMLRVLAGTAAVFIAALMLVVADHESAVALMPWASLLVALVLFGECWSSHPIRKWRASRGR